MKISRPGPNRKTNKVRPFFLAAVVACCSSCAVWDDTVEVGKTLWGSSTRALEAARDRAVTKTYDKSYWDCVRSAESVLEKYNLLIFNKNEVKGYVVIMHVPGAVDTTEVGIFFDELSDNQTKIEVASLSTNAKRQAAKRLWHGLDIAFGYIPPDKEYMPPEKPPARTRLAGSSAADVSNTTTAVLPPSSP